jgi:chloramphenicol 3-O phosphotransferase
VAAGVILLNGTSSAGKTTVAQELQERFVADGECWIVLGIDDFLGKLHPAWHEVGEHVGPHAGDGFVVDPARAPGGVRVGPIGERLLAAYRAAVRAIAEAGINVVVDEVNIEERGAQRWGAALHGLDVLWVRIDAADAVKAERESARSDRLAGLAAAQRDRVHAGVQYDVTIDTGATDPGDAADRLHDAWAAHRAPEPRPRAAP